ncbi:aminoacyl-tRNA hydrolase [Candidatus Falkowbacteria bacterium]|nr:aminoacyl-tRNA hydrolase [Candidatus Falkowbacteria bacterium]
MKFIIGLGNPGRQYAKTRHNIGWVVLDALAGKKAKWQDSDKALAQHCRVEINDQEVELLKPQTFMNVSGKTAAFVVKKHHAALDDLIIVHDDKDLPFGKIKLVRDHSSAGHRGVQSIIDALGTQDFWRLRIGVANNDLQKMATDKFVLSPFRWSEKRQLKELIDWAVREIEGKIS